MPTTDAPPKRGPPPNSGSLPKQPPRKEAKGESLAQVKGAGSLLQAVQASCRAPEDHIVNIVDSRARLGWT